MKIVYGVLCHCDAPHIERLANKLTIGTENEVIIHVDAKSDFAPFSARLENKERVKLLDKRKKVFWGGYAAVEATIDIMRAALEHADFDRFVLLQGLVYPIKCNSEIETYFGMNEQTEFMLAQDISHSRVPRKTHKYRLFYDLDHARKFHKRVIHKINRMLLRIKLIPPLKRNYVLDAQKRKNYIYHGYAEFALTRKAIEYIVAYHDNNPSFNKYFMSMYAPDETYFHSIIYNSEFMKQTPFSGPIKGDRQIHLRNFTYFSYENETRYFTKADEWDELDESGYLFVKKVSSESKELLDYIDLIHGEKGI